MVLHGEILTLFVCFFAICVVLWILDLRRPIWISNARNLQADKIFHIDIDPRQRNSETAWPTLITQCLSMCDQSGNDSVAFPILSTGICNTIHRSIHKMW